MADESRTVDLAIRPSEVLTEAQLACVRLVPIGPSKVIAKELGISHHTVDDHLREALRRLGVSTRHEAAALVLNAETGHPQVLGTQAQRLAKQGYSAKIGLSSAVAGTSAPVPQNAVREERAEFSVPHLGRMPLGRLTRYWFGSLYKDLTGPNRVRGTMILALILSITVMVLVGVGNTVQVSVDTYLGRH